MESSLASCAYSHFNQRRAVRVVPYSRLPTKQCPLVITGTDDIAGGRGLAEQRNCGAPGGGSRASRRLAQALSGTTVGGYRARFTARAHPVKVVEAVVRSHRLIAKPAVSPSTYPMPLMSLARFAGCLSPWPTKRWIQPG